MPISKRKEIPDRTKSLLLVLTVLAILIVGLGLCSCSPKIIDHYIYQRDTTYVAVEKVDSIFHKDSVFIREKGDSVYIYKEKNRYKYIYLHDTTYKVKVDSVLIEREKIVEMEKPLAKSKQLKMDAFWWLIGALALCLLWIFRKPILKLIKP